MRLSRPVTVGIATVLTFGFAGWVVYRVSGVSEGRDLQVQLARARRLGLPADMTEMWPAAKDPGHNAAPIYTALSTGPHSLSRAANDAKAVGYPRSENDRKAIQAAIRAASSELTALEAAVSFPECRFMRQPAYDVPLPEYATMWHGAELLVARALLESAKGDPLHAMRTLATAAKMGPQLAQDPLIPAKIVQGRLEHDVLEGIERVLDTYGRRADVRHGAREALANLGAPPDIKDGWRGEWGWRRQVVRDYRAGKIPSDKLAQVVGYDEESPERTRFLLQMRIPGTRLRQEEIAARLFLDFYEAIPDDPTHVAASRQARARWGEQVTAQPGAGLAHMETAFVGLAETVGAQAIVRRRLLQALLNALDAPTPPKSLPLTGDGGIDPFNGKPLRYTAGPGSIRIWSVGPNGKDEGGNVSGDKDGKGDLVAVWGLRKP